MVDIFCWVSSLYVSKGLSKILTPLKVIRLGTLVIQRFTLISHAEFRG